MLKQIIIASFIFYSNASLADNSYIYGVWSYDIHGVRTENFDLKIDKELLSWDGNGEEYACSSYYEVVEISESPEIYTVIDILEPKCKHGRDNQLYKGGSRLKIVVWEMSPGRTPSKIYYRSRIEIYEPTEHDNEQMGHGHATNNVALKKFKEWPCPDCPG